MKKRYHFFINAIIAIIIAIDFQFLIIKPASSSEIKDISQVSINKKIISKNNDNSLFSWPFHLLRQAELFRKSGEIGLAEACSDEAWNEIVCVSSVKTQADQDRLVELLWSKVALPYLDQQRLQITLGEGTKKENVSAAIDVKYSANKANQLIKSILYSDYKNRLMIGRSYSFSPLANNIDFNSEQAQRARAFLNFIGQSVGMTANGLAPILANSNADLQQPAGANVYVEASKALFGSEISGLKVVVAKKALSVSQPQICLLSALQIETTVVAIERRNFMSRSQADYEIGNRLLQYLTKQYPKYPRAEQIKSLEDTFKLNSAKK